MERSLLWEGQFCPICHCICDLPLATMERTKFSWLLRTSDLHLRESPVQYPLPSLTRQILDWVLRDNQFSLGFWNLRYRESHCDRPFRVLLRRESRS
jgi:hypothetical protein